MYPKNHCYFCKSEIANHQRVCKVTDCFNEYNYYVGADQISFMIEEYEFIFYYFENSLVKTRISSFETGEDFHLNEHLLVTEQNYRQVIKRLNKLQVFQ